MLPFSRQYYSQDVITMDLDWGNVRNLDKHHIFSTTSEKLSQNPRIDNHFPRHYFFVLRCESHMRRMDDK